MLPSNIIYIAVIVSLIAYFFYFKNIFYGSTKPNLVSWFIWMLAPLLGFFFDIKAGAGLSALPVFLAGFGPLVVIIISILNKNAYWKLTAFDFICGIFALISLVLYIFTHNLEISIIFVILSDGETNEGSVWEAALCATKHKLDNLILLVDYNKQQSYGYNKDVLNLEPFADKWKSFGFAVTEVNGHDVQALKSILKKTPLETNKPTTIICHTIKGKGISFAEENLEWHHKAKISEEEVQLLMKALENKSHA